MRHARRPEEFLTAFNGRLQALGRTHGLLSDHEWRSVNLEDLVRLELQTMHPEDRERIRMTGEPVTLTPDQALALSLILHELASNAVNHGSLSVDGGGVELTWGTTADSQRLSLDWVEHGGPKVAPPQTKGFGSILIRRSLDKVLSSAVTHEFDPDGVRARLDIPLEGREA